MRSPRTSVPRRRGDEPSTRSSFADRCTARRVCYLVAPAARTLGEIQKWVELLPAGARRERLATSVVTELPRQFLGRVLMVDERVALAWGRLSAEGCRSGRELPVIDGLLLATAAANGLVLVTRNELDCSDRGVPILNPWN